MRDWGIDDYGLVLNTNHLQMLASQVYSNYSEEEWNSSSSNRYEYIEQIAETIGIDYISEFSGEATPIYEDGTRDWTRSEIYNDDTIYYVSLCCYPNLFHASYKDMDEIVTELKSRVGKYFPKDFNYREYVCHIVGTYFG